MFRKRRIRKREKPQAPPKKQYEKLLSTMTLENIEKLEVNKPEPLSDSSKEALSQIQEKLENNGDPKKQKIEKTDSNLEKLSSLKKKSKLTHR